MQGTCTRIAGITRGGRGSGFPAKFQRGLLETMESQGTHIRRDTAMSEIYLIA
jgi:hypothetical protein